MCQTTFSDKNRVTGLPMIDKEGKNRREIKRGDTWEQKTCLKRGNREKQGILLVCEARCTPGPLSENNITPDRSYSHMPRKLRSGSREKSKDGIPAPRKCTETQLGEHHFPPWGKLGQDCPLLCNHAERWADMYLL
jgi:hypothetical protein